MKRQAIFICLFDCTAPSQDFSFELQKNTSTLPPKSHKWFSMSLQALCFIQSVLRLFSMETYGLGPFQHFHNKTNYKNKHLRISYAFKIDTTTRYSIAGCGWQCTQLLCGQVHWQTQRQCHFPDQRLWVVGTSINPQHKSLILGCCFKLLYLLSESIALNILLLKKVSGK